VGETNPDHDFSDVFTEQDLADVALFIAETTTDYDAWVDADKMAIDGNMEDGQLVYEELCTGCHGPEGTAMNFSGDDSDSEYVAVIATGNPWEFLHKVRYGQPGTAMPSGIDVGLADQEYADLLAHAQSLSQEAPALVGGRLYDKWWGALNIDAPEDDQPLWATQETNTRSGSDTWRCKECHGWDYKGVDGAYGSGSHLTGFPGIFEDASMPVEELTGWLDGAANADHDFSGFMDESQIGMLVTFLQSGMVDTTEFINDDKSANGDPAAGEKLYNVACSRCHGDDGLALNFGDEAEPEYVTDIATDNPWEFWHKASYGQPGESMPSGVGTGWTEQDIADVLSYVQTLSAESE
jgi:thiosulfate dehydrogenase